MWLFVALVLAGVLGLIALRFSSKRPLLGLAAVVILPPLLLLWRYLTFASENDWEGMGALAFSFVASGWIIISLVAGAISIHRSKRSR